MERQGRTDWIDRADSTEVAASQQPMDPIALEEPMDSTDRTEPMLPTESMGLLHE